MQQAMTPWEELAGHQVKRDDLYQVAGSRGGKVRTCLALASQPGVLGLVTAGSRQSPQGNIVASIAQMLGLPCQVHVPAAKGPLTPELSAASARGAEICQHRPGHNSVIVSRARRAAAELGWAEIPFGMECEEAVRQTSRQVANMPWGVERLVVPVGSGMSLAGILSGLEDLEQAPPVLGVVVGASPVRRLDRYAPAWWRLQAELVPAGLDYHAHAPTTSLGGVELDPVYEAKCLPFLQPGDGLWVVGRRENLQ
jgi:1-aminocyclopropane-1-carboxylate deaminase/D-cysteine desulfhydrase-like pyridoxal-dependent ACC family enzyme